MFEQLYYAVIAYSAVSLVTSVILYMWASRDTETPPLSEFTIQDALILISILFMFGWFWPFYLIELVERGAYRSVAFEDGDGR